MELEQLSDAQLAALIQLSYQAEKIIAARTTARLDEKARLLSIEIRNQEHALNIVKAAHKAADNNFRKKIIAGVWTHVEKTLMNLQAQKEKLRYEYPTVGYYGPVG